MYKDDEEEAGGDVDNFKPLFKQTKALKCGCDLSREAINYGVVDFTQSHRFSDVIESINWSIDDSRLNSTRVGDILDDFSDPRAWKVYSFKAVPGLIVVHDIFTPEASEKWRNYALHDLPANDVEELRSNVPLPTNGSDDKSNLRWITIGYHHNWDTKMYDESIGKVPPQLDTLFTAIARLLSYDTYRIEAGIVNYYTCKSNLSPHVDRSEPNMSPPLFSLSLGSPAVFLCGGETKSHPVVPMVLRNGDLLIMSGQSRKAYHAVSKVFCERSKCEKSITRINFNVRQVN